MPDNKKTNKMDLDSSGQHAQGSEINAADAGGKEMAKDDLDSLYALSRQGMWGLLIFLAASAVALACKEQTLTGAIPAAIREFLGPKPPVILINIVLGVSTFSSIVLIGGRIHDGKTPGNTWTHLWFRISFYLLYFISDALLEHFYIVFMSGLTVMALQHYNVWNFTNREIEIRTNIWERLSA